MITRSVTEVDRISPETRVHVSQALKSVLSCAERVRDRDPTISKECDEISAELNDIARWLGIELS
jgi:hypothetical protein